MYPSSNVKMADAKTAKNSNQHVIIPSYTDKLFLLFLVLFLHAVSAASKFRSVGIRLLSGKSPRIDLVRVGSILPGDSIKCRLSFMSAQEPKSSPSVL